MLFVPSSAPLSRHLARSRWAAFGAAVAVTLGGGGLLTTSASIGTGERGVYVPIAPCRLFDTRPAPDNVGPRNTPLGPGDTLVATVRGTNGNCTIPTDAVGLTMNIVVINPTSASFLTVYPADVNRPLASNLNWVGGQPPLANAVTADISADGKIAFYNLAGTVNVAADIVGYYADHNHDDRYYTKPQIDTDLAPLQSGGSRVILDTLGNVGSDSAVAIGTDGNPIVAELDNTNTDLKVIACTDPACIGDVIVTPVDTGPVGLYNSIAIGADGLPVISYQDTASSDLKVAKCINATCTGASTITTLDATDLTGYFTSIAIGTDGNPVVAYFDNTTTDLMVAKCQNPACTGSPVITTVEASADIVGYYAGIAVRADGRPIIAYADITTNDLKVAACVNAACTGTATITTLDAAGATGFYPSLALGRDGLAAIAYFDGTSNDLRFARCVSADCTGVPTLSTLDAYGNVGTYASVGIAGNGAPVIAEWDSTKFDLRIVACGTATCSGRVSATTIDAEFDAGYQPALAIGADGFPVITHYDTANLDLRFAKCASYTCLP
jgi:hypothetical protein